MKKPFLYVTYKKQSMTFYKFLGVEESCTDEELKKAYRAKAREYHPDLNKGDKQKEALFKALQIVWERLKTPEARRQHDRDLALDRTPRQQAPFDVVINGMSAHFWTNTTSGSASPFTMKDFEKWFEDYFRES